MKASLLISGIAILCGLAATSACAQSKPNFLFLGLNNSMAGFLDTGTVQGSGGKASGWILWVYEPVKQNARYSLDMFNFDCTLNQDGVNFSLDYDVNGAVLKKRAFPKVFRAVKPGSMGEAFHKRACGTLSGDDKAVQFQSVNAAISFGVAEIKKVQAGTITR